MNWKSMVGRLGSFCKALLHFLINPRFLLCFGFAWMITNGWSYVLLAIGSVLRIGWMVALAGGYLAFLWLPISPEKLATLLIAMGLLRWLFPNDRQTLGVLKELYAKCRAKVGRKRGARSAPTDAEDGEAG